MSALAPSLEAYFTDRLVSQRAASPNTIAAYALTFRLLLAFASRRSAIPPNEARHRRARRAARRGVPRAPRARATQRCGHPQHAPCRDPLALFLSRAASPRACGLNPARPLDSTKADRVQLSHLLERGGGDRVARGVRSAKLDRPARSHDVCPHDPDGAAHLRARRTQVRGRVPRPRRQRAHLRQGEEGATHAARSGHDQGPRGVAS